MRVDISEKSGQIRVFAQKEVVEEVLDPANEISLAEAHALNPNYTVGDVVEVEVTPRDFGRIAAQTAKQVVIQRSARRSGRSSTKSTPTGKGTSSRGSSSGPTTGTSWSTWVRWKRSSLPANRCPARATPTGRASKRT